MYGLSGTALTLRRLLQRLLELGDVGRRRHIDDLDVAAPPELPLERLRPRTKQTPTTPTTPMPATSSVSAGRKNSITAKDNVFHTMPMINLRRNFRVNPISE